MNGQTRDRLGEAVEQAAAKERQVRKPADSVSEGFREQTGKASDKIGERVGVSHPNRRH